jgi:DNA-binding HxlR family transcriptional regulator
MDLIGGAWTAKVIWHLQGGSRRFSELRSYMAPISAKVLSQRLKELEAKHVVQKGASAGAPASTEYALTALGHKLIPAIESIAEVGHELRKQGEWPRRARRSH